MSGPVHGDGQGPITGPAVPINNTIGADNTTAVARPLAVLAPLIHTEIEAATVAHAAGVEHYRRAGELLMEAKAGLPHGGWQSWVRRNFKLSIRTARDYMRLAENAGVQKGTAVPFSTLRAARAAKAKPRQFINVQALAQQWDEEDRKKQALCVLAREIVQAGYKALAFKMHPDKGGTNDGFTMLGEAKCMLAKMLKETR